MSTEPSKPLVEVYPGAKDDIDRMVEAAGGWVCEEHPDLPWPHDNCPGPGMLLDDAHDEASSTPRSRSAIHSPT